MRHSTNTTIFNEDKEPIARRVKIYDNNILDKQFDIPIIDVRRSEEERKRGEIMERNSNTGSKYMKPSFSVIGKSYQASHKKNNN